MPLLPLLALDMSASMQFQNCRYAGMHHVAKVPAFQDETIGFCGQAARSTDRSFAASSLGMVSYLAQSHQSTCASVSSASTTIISTPAMSSTNPLLPINWTAVLPDYGDLFPSHGPLSSWPVMGC